MIDFVHCGVEYHASFTKQSLSSTLEKSLAVTLFRFIGAAPVARIPLALL
jgi:hypothetical protein